MEIQITRIPSATMNIPILSPRRWLGDVVAGLLGKTGVPGESALPLGTLIAAPQLLQKDTDGSIALPQRVQKLAWVILNIAFLRICASRIFHRAILLVN